MKDYLQVLVVIGLVVLIVLGGNILYRASTTRIEIIDAEPGVRCAMASSWNAVAINCWRIDE